MIWLCCDVALFGSIPKSNQFICWLQWWLYEWFHINTAKNSTTDSRNSTIMRISGKLEEERAEVFICDIYIIAQWDSFLCISRGIVQGRPWYSTSSDSSSISGEVCIILCHNCHYTAIRTRLCKCMSKTLQSQSIWALVMIMFMG